MGCETRSVEGSAIWGCALTESVRFTSRGLSCAADLYLPEGVSARAPRPALVLGHGFGGLKDGLVAQSEYFRRAGYVVLTIDYRYFGESEGEPRGQLFPLEQVEDMRNAISYVQRRAEVDPQRIGLWGTSFGGAIVIYTAAVDRRVRAVVSQVPIVNGRNWMRALRAEGDWDALLDRLDADRQQRYDSGASAYVSAGGATLDAAMPTSESERLRLEAEAAPPRGSGDRQLTLESVERVIEFFPEHMIHMIGPRPLRIITTAERDVVHPLDQIQEAYERAREPKDLVLLPLRQYDAYSEPGLTIANESAREWFERHLPVQASAPAPAVTRS